MISNTLPRTDYSQLVLLRPCTRNQTGAPCQCTVCVLARTKFPYQTKELLSKFVFPKSKVPPPPSVLKQCVKCYSYLGKGLSHNCTKTTKRVNQAKIVKNSSRKTKEKVTSSIVKHIFEERGIEQRGGTVTLATGGTPLNVTLSCKPKSSRFDLDSMMRLQTACNLSDKTLM